MKKYSASLYSRKMKIETSIRFFFFFTQKSVVLSINEDLGKQKFLCKLFSWGWVDVGCGSSLEIVS